MRIAVLGTGSVGRAIAARTAELGHQVTIGTRDVAPSGPATTPTGRRSTPRSAWRPSPKPQAAPS
ncbi:NAD(P)-binding domain-containing protein [Micromonospora arida]|uniref:NAD(P)-binding domain-containing protein n=1 Tax=Micromonospora arida TaxID=2203715 RepID=UPI001FCA3EB0|nr:NAD(P)-binding domain-containing protein [Micromonospora arida]